MKIERKDSPPIVIGKRVTAGAAIGGVANAIATVWPEHSQLILALVVPVTFIAQVIIVNRWGVTNA